MAVPLTDECLVSADAHFPLEVCSRKMEDDDCEGDGSSSVDLDQYLPILALEQEHGSSRMATSRQGSAIR